MEKSAVLISGAGPTGLTLANLLSRMGVHFFLIDKKERPSRASKAFAVHARSLEIFNQLGIAEKAIEKGKTDSSLHLIAKDKVVFKTSLQNFIKGKSRFPHFLVLPQQETEHLLINALENRNRKVHWDHELLHFECRPNEVLATIKNDRGEENTISIQYLIGCDGANSSVRRKAGFTFEGETFSPVFYLADCKIDWEHKHGDIYFVLAKNYLSGIFSYSNENEYRIFNFLNEVVKKKDESLSGKEVQEIVDDNPYLLMKVKKVMWTSAFKIHSRYAKQFKKGRVMLAGDAAHVHSPAGGQGMNTGIQDAYNLAWKLSLAIKGKAKPHLLDSYHEERYPIAKNLYESTDRFFKNMVKSTPLMNFFRLNVLPLILKVLVGLKPLRKRLFERASQIAIHYRFSTLSRKGKSSGLINRAPKPGDRMPYFKIRINNIDSDSHKILKCTHFIVIIAVSDPESTVGQHLIAEVKKIGLTTVDSYVVYKATAEGTFFKAFGIKRNAVLIIRPDGHIGYRTSKLDFREIEGYFNHILGMPMQ